jgi:pSer/pThr/pTyr-binding forkhead associated (FHA) protein/S1-C subfamily serine protease
LSSSPPSSPSWGEGGRRRPTEAVLIVRSGASAGTRHRLTADFATLGRHPSSEVAFDPECDRDVSARHAAVFRQGPTFVVRDLGSTNGTWVNGVRIRSDRPLEPGDRIRLGARGPEVEFGLVEAGEAPPAAPPRATASPVAAHPGESPPEDRPSTDLRIRMEVARQTDRIRRRLFGALAAAAVAAVALLGGALWSAARERRAVAEERVRLLALVDSLQRKLTVAADQATGLRQALDSARREASRLRSSIAAEGESQDRLSALDHAVAEVLARHAPLVRAAGLDVAGIESVEGRSVALVFVEFADGRAASATGFLAASRGDTGYVITARHAVLGRDGAPLTRAAATFARRAGLYRARLVAADSGDVAVLRVVSASGFRAVRSLAAEALLRPGDPVALLGYPLGLDLPMGGDWTRVGVSPTTTVGTVSRVLPELIQLDAYGVAGASGSPVFNAAGEVVGMLFGGQPESQGRIVYAVPAGTIRALLDRVVPQAPER